MLQATQIELYHIAIPFKVPYRLSKVYGTLEKAHAVVVKVHTDAGIAGFGEADPMNPFTEETPGSVMVAVRELLAPLLFQQDISKINAVEALFDQKVHGHLMARGALNMALYDLLGKVHQVPAHTFLGGCVHEQVPLLGAIGNGTVEQDTEAINRLMEEGYRTVMIKMGAQAIADEIKRMKAATERFADTFYLIVDANQGWSLKETFSFVDGIHGFEPGIIEQPVNRRDTPGLLAIRQRTSALLSADESVVTCQDAAELAQLGAVDVFSIKVSKNGGIDKARIIATIATGFGIPCLMNSMLEFGITQAASLQLGCTLSNLMPCGHAYMSVLRMADDVTDFSRYIKRAVVTVPSKPGLGIEVDEDKLKQYTVDYLKISR